MITKEQMHNRAPVLLEFYEGINTLVNFEADRCLKMAKFTRVGNINMARRENPATDAIFFSRNNWGAVTWNKNGGEKFLKEMYPDLKIN